jgi:hypothetical protein
MECRDLAYSVSRPRNPRLASGDTLHLAGPGIALIDPFDDTFVDACHNPKI